MDILLATIGIIFVLILIFLGSRIFMVLDITKWGEALRNYFEKRLPLFAISVQENPETAGIKAEVTLGPPKSIYPTTLPDKEPEVFNIHQNLYSYKDASRACKALGSRLATLQEVKEAYNKGANWCNYGWIQNQMAVYPIQKDWLDSLPEGDKRKKTCGKPGINGGFFEDESLKFGANCYGVKPTPSPARIEYISEGDKKFVGKDKSETVSSLETKTPLPEPIIRPWRDDLWSQYSTKISKYHIYPEGDKAEIVTIQDNEDSSVPKDGSPSNVNDSSIESFFF